MLGAILGALGRGIGPVLKGAGHVANVGFAAGTIGDVYDRFSSALGGTGGRKEQELLDDDILNALNLAVGPRMERFREERMMPQLLDELEKKTIRRGNMGIADTLRDQDFGNFLSQRQQKLAEISQPMQHNPSLTEMAARLGLPV